jgi:[acyl-carrier-protein] S-malonyltransferase
LSKLAVLFPGQGAQSVGMGRTAFDSSAAVRELFEHANRVVGYDLAKLCFDGPASRLDSTAVSQPALFVCSCAGVHLLRDQSPAVLTSCQAAAGLSLGEYTALVFADVLDFETGLRLVQQRGEAMQAAADATPSGMVSILGMELANIESLCKESRESEEVLQVANLLCPGNIVVSGSQAACQRVAERAVQAGAMKAIPLAVAGAFHTPLMQPAVEKLSAALSSAKLSRPRIPVISNVDARPHDDPEQIRQLLLQQLIAPVRWEDSVRYLLDQGFDTFWEVGPGRVLRGLLKRIDRKVASDGVMV